MGENVGDSLIKNKMTFSVTEPVTVKRAKKSYSMGRETRGLSGSMGKHYDGGIDFIGGETIKGDAYACCRVSKASFSDVSKILAKESNAKEVIESHDFYMVLLNLSVMVQDPDKMHVNCARFKFSVIDADLMKMTPLQECAAGKLSQTADRTYSISPSLEFTPSIKMGQTNENTSKIDGLTHGTTVSTEINPAGKLGVSLSYDNKKGYTFEVPVNIKSIIGTYLPNNKAQWEFYTDYNPGVPALQIGKTLSVITALFIKVPKGKTGEVKVNVKGKVTKKNAKLFFFDVTGPVKLADADPIHVGAEIAAPNKKAGSKK
jgi:hypothetical protein